MGQVWIDNIRFALTDLLTGETINLTSVTVLIGIGLVAAWLAVYVYGQNTRLGESRRNSGMTNVNMSSTPVWVNVAITVFAILAMIGLMQGLL